MRLTRRSIGIGMGALVWSMALAGCANDQSVPETQQSDLQYGGVSDRVGPLMLPITAKVVAQGIPGAGAVTPVGTFHRSSPIHDKAAFAAFTAPGMVLEPHRLLVASSSSFGAPLARPQDAPGAVLSIDPTQGMVTVDPNLAAAGGQAKSADGRVQIYTNQDPAFLNSVNNPNAATAGFLGSSLPLGISINRGNGRPWVANGPSGASGAGSITVLDPSGAPLAGAPDATAGGVFAGDATNRNSASTEGLDHAAVGTAIMTKSPDGSTKAVFAAAEADGSVVQVHVLKGVDGLAPAGTFHPLTNVSVTAAQSTNPDAITRVGVVFNWVPNRTLYVSDPLRDQIVALDLSDDGTLFHAAAPRMIRSPWFHRPVDLAPAVPEFASENFSSNTTLGAGADIYVLNRGNNSIVRMTATGQVVAGFRIQAPLNGFRVNGIGVSEDAQTIWVTAVTPNGGGAVLQLPAFGAGFVTPSMVQHAMSAGATDTVSMGSDMFTAQLGPLQALGPLFNGRACGDCHKDPAQGGMGATPDTFVTRVGRIDGGVFDPLTGRGGPVARTHSITDFGFGCGLATGVPPLANVTSKRSAMTLRGTALLDFVQTQDILAAQAAEPADVRGKVNVLADGRVGKLGWKAQIATLVEFMGDAFVHEMGITNPLFPQDEEHGCGSDLLKPEIDALPLEAVDAFLATVDPPVPDATCLGSAGATTFASIGCASCHTPSFPGPGRTVNAYTDLLVHDMGPALADQFVSDSAGGSDFRTAPLWRVSEHVHFLHDGRAATISDAIAAHGGQAAAAAAAYGALDPDAQQALLAFLGCI